MQHFPVEMSWDLEQALQEPQDGKVWQRIYKMDVLHYAFNSPPELKC